MVRLQVHTHTRQYTHTYMYTKTNTLRRTHTHTSIHTLTHTLTLTHMHAHTHTHTHTHTTDTHSHTHLTHSLMHALSHLISLSQKPFCICLIAISDFHSFLNFRLNSSFVIYLSTPVISFFYRLAVRLFIIKRIEDTSPSSISLHPFI